MKEYNYKKIYFNKFFKKLQNNGLKYKLYLNLIESFKILFLIKKQYNIYVGFKRQMHALNFELITNIPLFTRRKKKKRRKKIINKKNLLISIPLPRKKKLKELLKWIKIIINKQRFKKLIFRIAFFITDLFVSNKHNILTTIRTKIVKALKRKHKKKIDEEKERIKKNFRSLKYLGTL